MCVSLRVKNELWSSLLNDISCTRWQEGKLSELRDLKVGNVFVDNCTIKLLVQFSFGITECRKPKSNFLASFGGRGVEEIEGLIW